MNVQLKKGVLGMCVLALLARGDCYGFEMVMRISGEVDMAEGTVYPLLKRLRDDKLLDSYLQESPDGPPRKYYRLTDAGRAKLAEMTSEWSAFVGGVNRILGEAVA